MNLKPGDVWLVDLGLAAKTRPIVLVSRYDPTPPRALVLYVPVTTQNRGSVYEVELLPCFAKLFKELEESCQSLLLVG